MGSGKSGGNAQVNEYYMSLHLALGAYRPGAQLLALFYGDKEVWRGAGRQADTFLIDKDDAFGGVKKEGGVRGLAWWLPGDRNQILPDYLASRFGLTPSTCPGFRGFMSVFLTGTRGLTTHSTGHAPATFLTKLRGFRDTILGRADATDQSGMLVAANNPYLRAFKARVRCVPVGLNPSIAMIRVADDSLGNAQYAANAVHIIFECLTNRDWGMGRDYSGFDIAAWETAAQKIYDENFGLNITWTRSAAIETFIQEVMDHIQAAAFTDPRTGRTSIKLLRADYTAASLPIVSPSNATLSNFERKTWGDVANEVVVTWTHPETGKPMSVVAQDLAGIAMQGGITSTAKNYYGIASQELAIKVAERDLAAAVQPLATCTAVVNRQFWETVGGDVVRLHWPERGIEDVIMRVTESRRSDNTVSLTLFEDIFGFPSAQYLSTGGTEWQSGAEDPQPATAYAIGTAPAFWQITAQRLQDGGDLDYPEAMSALVVAPDSDDDIGYELMGYTADVNGDIRQTSLGERPMGGTWLMATAIPAEAQTVLASLPGYRGSLPVPGQFILISGADDSLSEICVVRSRNSAGWTISRGLLDTVPRAWPVGTRCFAVPNISLADPTVMSVGEIANYHIRTITSKGKLPTIQAPIFGVELTDRAYRPLRPANVKVNGQGFGTLTVDPAEDLNITWSRRNRELEVTQAYRWDEADLAPEAGQTTRIVVRDGFGNTIRNYPGIVGLSFLIPATELVSESSFTLHVYSERDGLSSLQAHHLSVNRP